MENRRIAYAHGVSRKDKNRFCIFASELRPRLLYKCQSCGDIAFGIHVAPDGNSVESGYDLFLDLDGSPPR
jgi:hypothetical protein